MNKLQGLISISIVLQICVISSLFNTRLSYGARIGTPNDRASGAENSVTKFPEADLTSDSAFLENYLTIQSDLIEEVKESPIAKAAVLFEEKVRIKKSSSLDLDFEIGEATASALIADILLDKIINIGKKIWTLVDANKAVANFSGDRASAVPLGISSWEQMQEWKAPSSQLYHVAYKNFLGMTVLDFTFRLIYSYGGTVNGQGQYLTQIGVLPADLMVRWGYHFNVHASVPGITNAGTSASPIAAAEILVDWTLDNFFGKHIEGSQSFYVRGDGYFENVSGKLSFFKAQPIYEPELEGRDFPRFDENTLEE